MLERPFCQSDVVLGISYFLVVFVDDRFHVVHTAVANFDVILVEKAVVFVLFREVLRNKIEKCSADVSLDVDVLWMVVWLSVSAVGTVCKVKGDVQVVIYI